MEFVSMTCRNCGGKLKIFKDADQIICQYCETEYLINFSNGAISIRLFSEGIKNIQSSSDKAASELALSRLRSEISDLDQKANLVLKEYSRNFVFKDNQSTLDLYEIKNIFEKEFVHQDMLPSKSSRKEMVTKFLNILEPLLKEKEEIERQIEVHLQKVSKSDT